MASILDSSDATSQSQSIKQSFSQSVSQSINQSVIVSTTAFCWMNEDTEVPGRL